MTHPNERPDALVARLTEVEEQLREATETLDAIRNGEVDAVVVGGASGQVVYTLENADRPYRILVEQMKEGAVTLSGDGLILYCNQSFVSLVGRSAGELIGSRFADHVKEAVRLSAMLDAERAGESAELTLLTARAGDNPVNISIAPIAVEEGENRVLCGIVTDLRQNYLRATELAAVNQRLSTEITERTRTEERLAIALDAADMGNWEILADGSTARSIRHDAIFGYSEAPTEWRLETALEHFVPDDRSAVISAFESGKQTGRIEFEGRVRRADDNAIRWVHVKGRNIKRSDGERVAGVIFDVTERKLIEEKLRQAQKMEAVGQLTGGIAHDFNNLLMIIGGSLEALARRATLEPRAAKLLAAARQGVSRGAKLNEQLLSFARRQDMKVEAICVNDLLPDFETLLDRAVGETVTVKIEREPRLWHCATDRHQLETAILNLAINARDAMGPGGVLTLSLANESVSASRGKAFEAAKGEYVVVALKDTGAGMPPEVIGRAFEPFFTTKEIGRGTGLGLSQVYGFAQQSGGFVAIESRVGEGTIVSIYLPRTRTPLAMENGTPILQTPSKGGIVLLVEDDPDVRAASSAMLEELGYTVRRTGSAQEALDALREDERVDVLFTDVIMSAGMTGIELARAVQAEWPRIPVLLTSGYTAQRLIPAAMNDDLSLIRKPYTIEQLAAAIESARQTPVPA
ncbi:MAG: ATP-binding protein [Microvirga sp.]